MVKITIGAIYVIINTWDKSLQDKNFTHESRERKFSAGATNFCDLFYVQIKKLGTHFAHKGSGSLLACEGAALLA